MAANINEAFEKLWSRLVVESLPSQRSSITKATVTARYVAALKQQHLNRDHMKKRVKLETGRVYTSIDVAVHNGVVKDLTQCWSLQIKSAEPVLNEIKAWGWTIKPLRDQGGIIHTGDGQLRVSDNVRVGVVYAASEDPEVMEEAFDIFHDDQVGAESVSIQDAEQHAQTAAARVKHPGKLDLD